MAPAGLLGPLPPPTPPAAAAAAAPGGGGALEEGLFLDMAAEEAGPPVADAAAAAPNEGGLLAKPCGLEGLGPGPAPAPGPGGPLLGFPVKEKTEGVETIVGRCTAGIPK